MKYDRLIDEVENINPTLLRYINLRLEDWASWSLKEYKPPLYYAKYNMLHRFITLGLLPPEPPGPKPSPVNPLAEEMETIIKVMATKDMNSAQALREYFIGRGRGNQQRAAREMGLAIRQFQYHYKSALFWLEGWFTGQYAAHLVKSAVNEKYNNPANQRIATQAQ